MARLIKIDNVMSFEVMSGDGSLFSALERINRNFGADRQLNGECILEGLYIKARDAANKRRRDARLHANDLMDGLIGLGEPLAQSDSLYKTRRSKKGKDMGKLGASVYLINGVGNLSYDNLEEYRALAVKESDIIGSNVFIYVMRGMNDDARLFEEGVIDTPNVKFISDYTVLNVGNGTRCLCIGGSLSRHRSWLMSIGKYHENEVPVFNRKELDNAFSKCEGINCLITGCPNTTLEGRLMSSGKWGQFDAGLKKSIAEVSKTIDNVTDYLKYKGCNIFLWNISNTSSSSNLFINDGWEVVSMAYMSGGRVFPSDVYAKLMMKKRREEEERKKSKALKERLGDMASDTMTGTFTAIDSERLRSIINRQMERRGDTALQEDSEYTNGIALTAPAHGAGMNPLANNFANNNLHAVNTDTTYRDRLYYRADTTFNTAF